MTRPSAAQLLAMQAIHRRAAHIPVTYGPDPYYDFPSAILRLRTWDAIRRRGWVELGDPDDRGRRPVRLTEAGRAVAICSVRHPEYGLCEEPIGHTWDHRTADRWTFIDSEVTE